MKAPAVLATLLPLSRRQSGFTLPELLLASVLGAMLMTGLAVSTLSFTNTLDDLESNAGISGDEADPVLRRITRDIREAWWVESVSSTAIKIADTDGAMTEYYAESSEQFTNELFIKRPNGDTGVIFNNFDSIDMEPTYTDRFREGPAADFDGMWYEAAAGDAPASTLVVNSGEQIALAFVAPVEPQDIPGQPDAEEQVLTVSTSIFDLPLAWVDGTGTNRFSMTLYEGWAPGLARPSGAALASVLVEGSSVPVATQASGVWDVPSSSLPLSLPASLTPGTGYSLVLKPLGITNQLVVKAQFPASLPSDADQVSLKGTSESAPWVQQLGIVPFDVKGPWTQTTTVVVPVITRVTITIVPNNRPLQQRSAVVLSQAFTGDAWGGVVAGQSAP